MMDNIELEARIKALERQVETHRELLIKAAEMLDKNANVLVDQGKALLAMQEVLEAIRGVVQP